MTINRAAKADADRTLSNPCNNTIESIAITATHERLNDVPKRPPPPHDLADDHVFPGTVPFPSPILPSLRPLIPLDKIYLDDD